MAENTNVLDIFGLTGKQNQLLFSLQYYLSNRAIMNLKEDKVGAGLSWLREWRKRNNDFLSGVVQDEKLEILGTEQELKELICEIKKDLKVQTPLYLILLECCLFRPFYELPDAAYFETEELNQETCKAIKKLDYSKKLHKENCKYIAVLLGIDEKYVSKFIAGYKEAKNTLSGFWTKVLIGTAIGAVIIAVTAGLATPYIAAAFAGTGLYGAAAISAGLAALGGGAIAAGGFGMVGGLVVIVGGGAILGGVLGTGVGFLIASSPELTLSQSAKLQVVLKEIILGVQGDYKKIQEIMLMQQNTIFELRREIEKQKTENEENKELIKNLEKSLDILEKSAKMSMELA